MKSRILTLLKMEAHHALVVQLPEYRSAVWYHSPEQKATAEAVKKELQKTRFDAMGKKIVTEINDGDKYKWYNAEVRWFNPAELFWMAG